MKTAKLLKCAAVVLCTAALIPAVSLCAAADEPARATEYPIDFIGDLGEDLALKQDGIADYAVNGESVAFASGTEVSYLYIDTDGERKCATYTNESPVTALDYFEDKLYLQTAVNVYLYPQMTAVEHEFATTTFPVTLGGGYYTYKASSKELLYWLNDEDVSVGTGFTKIKKYGEGELYALKDNCLYKITGADAEKVSLAYTDFTAADDIYSADAAAMLKDTSYEVKIAKVNAGAYVTRIKDGAIGEKFEQVIKGCSTKKSQGVPCLVLGESGNASLIATNDGMFITATSSLTEEPYHAKPDDRINKYLYSLENVGVYSRPYVCGATKIATLECGSQNAVKITEYFYLDYIDTDFLKVTYEVGEQTVTGFIPADMLSQYSFAAEENEHEKLPYENYDDKTNVVAVVIVVIIVALIIIAVLYLAGVMAKSKNKRKKQKSDEVNNTEE